MNYPYKENLKLYRTVQSNITNTVPAGYSTKIPGITTGNTTLLHQVISNSPTDQDNDIRPEDSASQVSKSSTLLSTIHI